MQLPLKLKRGDEIGPLKVLAFNKIKSINKKAINSTSIS